MEKCILQKLQILFKLNNVFNSYKIFTILTNRHGMTPFNNLVFSITGTANVTCWK